MEFNVPFQHKYGYIRDELTACTSGSSLGPTLGIEYGKAF